MRQEWGISTVIMIKRGNPCPLCLPFCGKILIDDVWSGGSAKDGPYPLMSYAISQGLYHPRCKDSHTTYFEGISTPPDDVYTQEEIKEIEEKYKLEQKRLYAEKQSKKYGRLARYSLDEKEKKKYRAKQKKWRYAAKRYSYDFDGVEIFETLDARGKGKPVLEYQDIVNEIKSSEIGLELMSHLVENDVPVYLMYGVDSEPNETGYFFEGAIYVHADKTYTVKETALTIIHEATHAKINKPNTKNQEYECYVNEYKHQGITLTSALKKSIIKHIDDTYDYLEWE